MARPAKPTPPIALTLQRSDAVDVSIISSSQAFAARRDQYLDAVIDRSTTSRSFRICQALALLARARDTGDMTRVAEANQLIVDTLDEMPADSSEHKMAYGQGALDYLRILFLFGDDPALVFPSTRTKLLNGGAYTSLRYYQRNICHNPNRQVGLGDYNPWAPAAGTYNHQINEIATGLLIAQLYAGETYAAPDGTYPMKDDTDEGLYDANDYWHYWRNAFYKYLTRYGYGLGINDPDANLHMNWGNAEKDSLHYLPMYIGAYLNIRDFAADPTVSKYAEIYLDAMMADFAEDAVGDLGTGAHKRTYSGFIRGIRHWYHGVVFHLWFANVAYPLEDLGGFLYPWGGAGHTAMATSDYNPAHPDFPQVLIEVAVNKPPDGYMVTESVGPRGTSDPLYGEQGNWMMPDYALGFQLDNLAGQYHAAGGVYIDDTNGSMDGGLLIAPFVGTKAGHANANDPDYRYNPKTTVNGLLRPDVAILQYKENEAAFDAQELPCRIWIKDGFAELDLDSPWIFARAQSALGRDIFVAVRTLLGGHSDGGTSDGGSVHICNVGDDYLLWETSTSDRHASFDAFKTDVQDNPLVVGGTWIQYTSCRGESLLYHRTYMSSHKVDGVTIDGSQFAHVVNNPFISWTHEEREVTMAKAGYTAFIDFDGNDDGVFDDPVKVVNNVAQTGAPTIVFQPVDQTIVEGQSATFSLVAAGAVPLSYQWERVDVAIVGGNSPTWSTGAVSLADDGARFRCLVTNDNGTVTSSEAILHVTMRREYILGDTTWIAAERPTTVEGAFVVEADDEASEGFNMVVPLGTGNDYDGDGVPLARLTFTLFAPQAGDYTIWLHLTGPNGNSNSLFVGVDDSSLEAVSASTVGWDWTRLAATHSFAAQSAHELKIALREEGTRVDRILLTQNPRYTPADTGTPNAPPMVSITHPSDGATLAVVEDVTITAVANDPDGRVVRTLFYADGSLIGSDDTKPYEILWPAVTVGEYQLTVEAFDSEYLAVTSEVVAVTVSSGPDTKPPAKLTGFTIVD